MTLKRKLDLDLDTLQSHKLKQPKLVPFPKLDSDNDVMMDDAEPCYPELYHCRTDSSVSSASSAPSSPLVETPIYPLFDLYPHPFFGNEGFVNSDSHNDSYFTSQQMKIGLMQPSFRHKDHGCTQVPKLRIACASGPNGQRKMWSLCEQCGAVSIVDTD
ncbi:hypothetical protein M378DRAFT_158049 [Amanita muscaria Koide BX008]|uniref:Uncharacterized protein n=1 Tax=Amanita muscaria (strain Koide BX008) TaxID=946122 RepID=A0A0C2X3Y6_AMAMK|nr:hypothetical protein M378DRAFT_158049 [Amanita muscaria Koide BX008]